MNYYLIFGIIWVLVSLFIGYYIRGKQLRDDTHFKLGIIGIGISYALGLSMLLIIIFR